QYVLPDIVRGVQHFVTTACCDCQTVCYGVGLIAHFLSESASCRYKQQFFNRRLQVVSHIRHRGTAGDRYDCTVEKHLLKFFSHHFGQFLLKSGVLVCISVHDEKILKSELFPKTLCKIAAAVDRRDVGGQFIHYINTRLRHGYAPFINQDQSKGLERIHFPAQYSLSQIQFSGKRPSADWLICFYPLQ